MRIPAFIIKCLIATVWTIFVVLAFHAFGVNIAHPQWSFLGDFYPWLTAILVVSSAYLIALFRAKKDSTIHLIALLFIVLTLVCRILWVRYFDAQLYSDFRTYWNVGHSIVVEGVAAQSNLPGVYFLRSIFYTAPIQYIFGNSQQYLQLVNVFLVTITMVIFYDFGRRVFSAKIAAGALLFFFWNPDIWYGVTLANHDIAFLPWLAGLCWILYWIDKRLHDRSGISIPVALLSVTVGILIFLLEVQRGFGLAAWFALLSLLAYYLYNHYRENRVNIVNATKRASILGKDWLKRGVVFILVLLIIPLGTYELSKTVFIKTTGIWNDLDYLAYTSAKDVYGSDRYGEMLPWREEYSMQLPEELRTEFSVKKLLSEVFSDPVETIRHIFRKNGVLADPGGTLTFSSRPAEDPWVGRTNSDTVPMQRALHGLLSAILFFLLFLRLLLHPFLPIKRGGFFLIFFTAFLYLFIIFFTEAQARYSLFTVFLTSLLIAQLLFGEWTLRGVAWWDSIKRLPSRAIWRK
jgi:hypothetical protein